MESIFHINITDDDVVISLKDKNYEFNIIVSHEDFTKLITGLCIKTKFNCPSKDIYNLEGTLTLSRVSSDTSYLTCHLLDENSRIYVIKADIELHEFPLAFREGVKLKKVNLNGEYLGKTKQIKPLIFEIIADFGNRKELAIKHAQDFADDGWIADLYFGSQTSFSYDGEGKTTAKTIQYRYV